jgi:CBS-domain-containing membrane protein
MKRKVKDVMTTTVVTAETWTPFKALARTMATAGVSALPILDRNGWVVGIVSEGDLLLKEEAIGSDRRGFRRLSGRGDRRKARGLIAKDVMTSPVATISPEATPAEAARSLHDRGVKRLPVVDREARLVGIVSRQDLMKIFLREDKEIRDEIIVAASVADRSSDVR